MICGYVLFDSRGNPILIEAVKDEIRTHEFFSRVVEIVYSNIRRIVGGGLRSIRIDDYYIYLCHLSGFILAIVSDEPDDRLYPVAIMVLESILMKGYTAEPIFSNVVVRGKVKRIIAGGFGKLPISLRSIRDIARKIMNCLEKIEVVEDLDIETLAMEATHVEIGEKTMGFEPADIDIQEAINAYMGGRVEDALNLLAGIIETGDSARILYTLVALDIIRSSRNIDVPSHGALRRIIMGIKDDLARKYLRLTLELLTDISSLVKRKQLLSQYRGELLSRVENDDPSGIIYSLMLADAMFGDLVEYLFWRFEDKSWFITARLTSNIYSMDIMHNSPPNQAVWRSIFKKVDNIFAESLKYDNEAMCHYYYILQLLAIWGLYISDMALESGLEILHSILKREKEYRKKIYRVASTPNRLLALSTHLIFCYMLNILIDIAKGKFVKRIHDDYWNLGVQRLKWLIELRRKARIELHAYILAVVSILGILSRLALMNQKILRAIPNLVFGLTEGKTELLWVYDKGMYSEVVFGILYSLLNTSILLPGEYRSEILSEIVKMLEKLIDTTPSEHLVRPLIIAKTIETLIIYGDKQELEKARELIEKYRDQIPQFFVEHIFAVLTR